MVFPFYLSLAHVYCHRSYSYGAGLFKLVFGGKAGACLEASRVIIKSISVSSLKVRQRHQIVELSTRWEITSSHSYYHEGIDENMSIEISKHCLFGASKVAADIMVQKWVGWQYWRGCYRPNPRIGSGNPSPWLPHFLQSALHSHMLSRLSDRELRLIDRSCRNTTSMLRWRPVSQVLPVTA